MGVCRRPRRRVRRSWNASAEMLRVAAHPVRLQILERLVDGACCVKDLNELVPASQPVLSQHMAALRDASLVANYARGSLRCYYLTQPELVRGLITLLHDSPPPALRAREDVLAEVDSKPRGRLRGGRRA